MFVRSVEKLFSTSDLARMWNISESTVKRWADSGDLVCVRTRGGHRRFTLEEVSRFQRSQGFDAVGRLAAAAEDDDDRTDGDASDLDRALERPNFAALAETFRIAAVAGDLASVTNVLARLYLRGVVVVDIFERIVAVAMHQIGEGWMRGELTVADEHLATRTVVDALVRLHPELLKRAPNRKTALVGCPENEMHEVAARCAAVLLDLEGWNVVLLGMNTPFYSFEDALERHRAELIVVSSTLLVDLDRQSRDFAALAASASRSGARVVVGGAGFREPAVRARFPHDLYALSFRDLLRFSATV